jgi:hypothetical protein
MQIYIQTRVYIHANFQVYLLLGNHDLWHFQKCDVSSVNPLRAIDGIEVVDSPKILLLNDKVFIHCYFVILNNNKRKH